MFFRNFSASAPPPYEIYNFRFNEVSAEVYKDYTISLAYDLAQTKQKRAFSDHSDIVSRRMGFIPLPLGVVMLRVIYTSVRSTNPGALAVVAMAYICLFTFRVLGSIVILGKACDLIDEHRSKQDKKKNDVEERKISESKTKESKQDLNKTTVLGQDKIEVIERKLDLTVPADSTENAESDLFELPDQSSERFFLYQNSCEDRSDVIYTNMNSAMTVDDEAESENEMNMNSQDLANIVESSEAEMLQQQRRISQQEDSRNVEHRHELQPVQQTPTKQSVLHRVDSESSNYTGESLSPATKAKSLSSPDLIRREAEYEDWEEEEENLIVTDKGSIIHAPFKLESTGLRSVNNKNT